MMSCNFIKSFKVTQIKAKREWESCEWVEGKVA
jgi:hypothetical protein